MGTEAKLQRKIIQFLESEKWIVVKTIQLSKNGFPDIFAFKNGKTIFIEVKSENGKATDLQKYRIEQFQKEGFNAFICNSYTEFIHSMNENETFKTAQCESISIGGVSASPFLFFNADNMDIMKQYPDKYFDLAIVDPPYGI